MIQNRPLGLPEKVKLGPIFWPLALLGAVLVFNLIFTPGFFNVEMRDGLFYGSLVDIVNRAVPCCCHSE